MPQPYKAVGLIPTGRGVRRRAEIERNLDHIAHLIAAASSISSLDLPVRLVAVPEGALQGLTDEVFDLDHVTYAHDVAIDIPGSETRFLGDLARQLFIVAQAKARHEPFSDRSSENANGKGGPDRRRRAQIRHCLDCCDAPSTSWVIRDRVAYPAS